MPAKIGGGVPPKIQPSSPKASPSTSQPAKKKTTRLTQRTVARHNQAATGHASAKANETRQQSAAAQNQLQKNFELGSKSSQVGSQAKYGPTADLSKQQQQELAKHYGSVVVNDRLTQYEKQHSTYVKAAKESGRGLTTQEAAAEKSGKNTKNASIDHVIASGSGQNVFNKETLNFNKGKKQVEGHYQGAIDPANKDIDAAQKQVRSGIAKQAAAAGRMQGYNREIIKERKGESGIDVGAKRNEVLKKTLDAYQGKKETRLDSYKSVLKETFDSPGNLRVGDSSANTKISTGFDAPLDSKGKLTPRAERLLHTHQTFAPGELLTDKRLFTKDKDGKVLSSSKETAPPEVDGPVSSRTRSKTKKTD